jgi:hypothetical protein
LNQTDLTFLQGGNRNQFERRSQTLFLRM